LSSRVSDAHRVIDDANVTAARVQGEVDALSAFVDVWRVANVADGQLMTVTFDAAGGSIVGSGGAGTRKVVGGQSVGELPAASRAGYTLSGWYVADAGGSGVGALVSSDTVVEANVTYRAGWTANSYSITLDPSGGVAGAATVAVTYDAAVPSAPVASKAGATFSGWYTAPAGGVRVFDATGAPLAGAGGLTDAAKRYVKAGGSALYAQYVPMAYKVTFNANGGKVSKKKSLAKTYTYGAKLGKLPKATKSKAKFLGWYTAKKKGKKVGASAVVSKNIIYYAHWKKK
jgi:uncharacterized repeat protein (TIGR02543 family)